MLKKVWIFLGLSARENPDKTRLISSSFSDPLSFASLCWWPLLSLFSGSPLYFLLALLFSRYSPLYLCLFLFSSVFLSPYSAYFGALSNFLARFSGLALRLLLLVFFLVARSLSFHPIFTQNPLSTNLNYNNFLPWTRLWLCRYCCFASWSEIAKYWELLYNFNLTSLISHLQNAGCKLFAYAASHLLAHVKPSCNAQLCARGTLHWGSTLEYAHFIVICRYLLAHTNGVSQLRMQSRLLSPSPPPFHYVMAKIVPVVQLAVHAKSSTLYGRSYGRNSNFFRFNGLLLFCIIIGLRWALRAPLVFVFWVLLHNDCQVPR